MIRRLIVGLLLGATALLAGPPLICQRIDTGNAPSLPWRDVNGWQGMKADYDVGRLEADTLALLTPAATISARSETLRRAAIYATREPGLALRIAETLTARAGKHPPALTLFDAGFFIEAVRQAAYVAHYDMLSKAEKKEWRLAEWPRLPDGMAMVEQAIARGGKGMETALGQMREYNAADVKAGRLAKR
jgi:hypothetical protein